jgi:hypothetical protein
MPMYEYKCDANGQVIEVVHRMSERYTTWGELCAAARLPLGDTPADAPVAKLVGGGSPTNAPNTLKKQNAVVGDKSKSLKHGATVNPMRSGKF